MGCIMSGNMFPISANMFEGSRVWLAYITTGIHAVKPEKKN